MYGSKFTLKLYVEIVVLRVPSLQCSTHRTDHWTKKKNSVGLYLKLYRFAKLIEGKLCTRLGPMASTRKWMLRCMEMNGKLSASVNWPLRKQSLAYTVQKTGQVSTDSLNGLKRGDKNKDLCMSRKLNSGISYGRHSRTFQGKKEMRIFWTGKFPTI